ncbi:MAG: YjbH domain-containing protein [Rikenellaceae bacterium]
MKINIRIFILSFWMLLSTSVAFSQYSMGSVGLLNAPTAQLSGDGVASAGVNFLPEVMSPDEWDYNSANYFLNITFLPFVEVGLKYTLIHFDNGVWNQDRSVSLRLRALKERKYLPAIAIGTNDLLTFRNLNTLDKVDGNRYFSAIYAVATKHIDIAVGQFGVTFGGYVPVDSNQFLKGLFGGVSFEPKFYSDLKFLVEYNNRDISAGAVIKLFNNFSLYAFAYDMKALAGGIRYEIDLY